GKTRVAGEVARRIQASGSNVWFCELASTDPESVEIVVAAELRVEERAGMPLRRRITDALSDDPGLLVLDSCEHVLDAASVLVDDILRRCPHVTVLVTSRERLAVEGEHLTPIAPFTIAPDASEHDPALQLFAARAAAVAPDFALSADTRLAVVEVCRRLD